MVSQGSYCDSDGIPAYMRQDDNVDVLEKGFSSLEVVSKLSEGFNYRPSCSGGIPLARNHSGTSDGVLSPSSAKILAEKQAEEQILKEGFVEDYCSSEEEEEYVGKRNPSLSAAFSINKNDRAALVEATKKLNAVGNFLKKRGFSFEDVVLEDGNFNLGAGLSNYETFMDRRDDLCLPKSKNECPNKVGSSGAKDQAGVEIENGAEVPTGKSWS